MEVFKHIRSIFKRAYHWCVVQQTERGNVGFLRVVVLSLPRLLWAGLRDLFYPLEIAVFERFALSKALSNKQEKNTTGPKISIVMPTFNSDLNMLREAIDSVTGQVYENWELCISDDASDVPSLRGYLRELREKYPHKIKLHFRERRGHICLNSNDAIEMASGEYIAFLDHDDILHPLALWELVKALNQPENQGSEIIYTDEDKLSEAGTRVGRVFKPTFLPEQLFSCFVFGHLTVYRASLIKSLGGFRLGFEGSQDWDLALRATDEPRKVLHIRQPLYHWRIHEASTAKSVDVKPYTIEASKRAILEAFKRRGLQCELISISRIGHYKWKNQTTRI